MAEDNADGSGRKRLSADKFLVPAKFLEDFAGETKVDVVTVNRSNELGMSRNVLLFVCLCLGGSLLMFHFRQGALKPAVSLKKTVPSPVDNPPLAGNDTVVAAATSNVRGAHAVEQIVDSNPASTAEAPLAIVPKIGEAHASAVDEYAALRALRAWAARDAGAALAAVLTLPEGDERNEALSAVCFGLAQTDPAVAIKLAQDLHLDNQSTAVMPDLVQQWATTDLDSSLVWAADQPAGASRDESITRIAFIMSQGAPSDAAALVMSQIPPGPARDEAIMTVIQRWGNEDLVAAANWAKDTVTGPLQDRVLRELNGILDYRTALAQP
jgi:hypothetical protein